MDDINLQNNFEHGEYNSSILSVLSEFASDYANHLETNLDQDPRSGYHLKLFQDTIKFFETGNSEGIIDSTMGTGKTVYSSRMAIELAKKGIPTIFIVPNLHLVENTVSTLYSLDLKAKVGTVNGDNKDFDKLITVMTYPSFMNAHRDGLLKHIEPGIIFIDESHLNDTKRRSEALDSFENSYKVHLSGTPFSQDLPTISGISFQEAVDAGFIAGVQCILVETEIDISEVEIVQGDYDPDEFMKLIEKSAIDDAAIELYLENYYRDKNDFDQMLIFCANIEHAEKLAQKFRDAGVEAHAEHSKQNKQTRKDLDQAFRNGKYPVSCVVQSKSVGWDYPDLMNVMRIPPSQSAEKVAQEAARSGRIVEGKNMGTVIEFIYKGKQITYPDIIGGSYFIKRRSQAVDYEETEELDEGDFEDIILPNGFKVIKSPEEVLRIVRENEMVKPTRLNPTDLTMQEIAQKYGINYGSVKRSLREISLEIVNPNDRMFYRGKDSSTGINYPSMFYTKEFIANYYIRSDRDNLLNVSEIMEITGASESTIYEGIKAALKGEYNPNLCFKTLIDPEFGITRRTRFFNRDFLEKHGVLSIRASELSKFETVDDGSLDGMTVEELEILTGLSTQVIQGLFRGARKVDPEFMEENTYKSTNPSKGIISLTSYYTPEAIERFIKIELKRNEDDLTFDEFAKKFNLAGKTLRNYRNQLRKEGSLDLEFDKANVYYAKDPKNGVVNKTQFITKEMQNWLVENLKLDSEG